MSPKWTVELTVRCEDIEAETIEDAFATVRILAGLCADTESRAYVSDGVAHREDGYDPQPPDDAGRRLRAVR